MSSQTIIPATSYTPLPPVSERKTVYGFGWLTKKKPEPMQVKRQLPSADEEELLRLWEDTDKMLERQRYEDQADFKNAERQMGKVLHSSELVRRIQKLNPNLIVEDSVAMKGNAAFYLVDKEGKHYTNASFNKGHVPEFTIMTTDAADLPVHYPTYGWRTVLVRLLKFNAITWQQVLSTFGDVHHHDSRGRHWKLNVAAYRI